MKKLLFSGLAFFVLSQIVPAQTQIEDTLNYFTYKQFYRAPTFAVHPTYDLQAALYSNTMVTHVGSIFKNTMPLTIKGLEARVQKDPVNPSIYGVAMRIYLCNVVNGLPVLPALDSITTNATSTTAPKFGQLVGGSFTAAPVTVTGDFAVLVRSIAGMQGDVLKVFRTAGHTPTSTATPDVSMKFGEGLGVIRNGGVFYSTRNYNYAGFGMGTDYEFCVSPIVHFDLEAKQIESATQEGACCWEVFTNTNTSTPALTNRQFNFNEFYRQWKPFNAGTIPSNAGIDSVLTWNLGDGSKYYLPPGSPTVNLYFASGNCNVFYTGNLTAKYRRMASRSNPAFSASLTFTSSTVYCGPIGFKSETAPLANVQVFPNPAADQVTVSGLTGTNTVWLYGPLGQLISSQVTDQETLPVDLQKLPAGNYLLRISNAENQVKAIKMLKLVYH
jgi:hypothetical protein